MHTYKILRKEGGGACFYPEPEANPKTKENPHWTPCRESESCTTSSPSSEVKENNEVLGGKKKRNKMVHQEQNRGKGTKGKEIFGKENLGGKFIKL
ncbi:hypothetical protein RUM43_004353 [Polyplax serrata]|uniref:Uncharacterized protein n=1 Tax=Polyplax serrata TaxID=468196 RepID=A0AAN8XN10_POLSC